MKTALARLLAARGLWLIVAPLLLTVPLPERFWTAANLQGLLGGIAIEGIMCVGMTIVMVAGGFDLSIGSVMALAGVVVVVAEPLGPVAAVALALGAAGLVGLANGLLIARLAINPFIATLATMIVVRAGVLTWTGSEPVSGSDAFLMELAHAHFLGVPVIALVLFGLGAAGHLFLTRWRMGREIHALGGNEAAARASGLPTARLKMLCYLLSALAAGLAGVLLAGRLATGSPVVGEQAALNVITAVLLGGTSLKGGVGTVAGSLAGLLSIATLESLMRLADVPAYWQRILQGALLLAIIIVDRVAAMRRRRTGADL